MTLPDAVREGVERALAERPGHPDPIVRHVPVGGGCISPVARIELRSGARYFLKRGGNDLPPGLLSAEARGLRELAGAGAVRVPEVVAIDRSDRPDWLLLEWLEPGIPNAETWPRLGRELAALHRTGADRFGMAEDNYIGPLPQANASTSSWAEFWGARRLEPQLRRAVDGGRLGRDDRDGFDRLFARLPEILEPADADGPSLLHGDLWNGNVHVTDDGTPAVIDPSAYFGHREVDLAMAELFGGFDRRFHDAYREAWPLQPGYAPHRRAAYQLYYLLVHVNLFGGGYVAGTRNALREATG